MEYHIKQNEQGRWIESHEPTETKVTTTHQGLKLYLQFLNDKVIEPKVFEEPHVVEPIKEVKPKKSRKK